MKLQKRLASQALKCGPGRVRFDPTQLAEIKEAITSFDIMRLINKGTIYKIQSQGVSRARAKQTATQKSKGRQTGHGSRKGKQTARQNPKDRWIANIRAQRKLLSTLKQRNLIGNDSYKILYAKAKGGFFRSTSHIKLYLKEQEMIKGK